MTTTMIAKLVVFMAGAFVTMAGLGTVLVGNMDQQFTYRGKTALTVGALLIMVGVGTAAIALSR